MSQCGTFQRVVYRFGLVEGIRAGHLVDVRAFRVRTDVALDRVGTAAGDFVAGALEAAVNTLARNAAAVPVYAAHAAGRRALVFAAGVAYAHDLAQAFRQAGIAAEAVDGSTEAERRHAKSRWSGRILPLQSLVPCSPTAWPQRFIARPRPPRLPVARPSAPATARASRSSSACFRSMPQR